MLRTVIEYVQRKVINMLYLVTWYLLESWCVLTAVMNATFDVRNVTVSVNEGGWLIKNNSRIR